MLTEAEKEVLRVRLRRIGGQINGIEKMLDEGRYCVDILQQVTAARAALNKVALLILESHAKSCLVAAVQQDRANEAIDELMDFLDKFTR
ncbi:protein of unknown function DUF156 [Thermosinus carboxydivorans Nor1]|uniref:Copper-sensing transcriptional repressor CsoR n=2 Tax=Sporomusaceae TaxID=1843490 RepID=A1HP89_9FIRM|nr:MULTISPECIES: metal-sensitive transcriptional regulator [Sporomusaceae]EAX48196.1 protein of unknown function DUF156 [Thermosinus carboxydivorans Nor1]SDF19243.1 DNA-binding transcriptional regulator, FrmR family [Sporolituus thermophilus DSM 23256]